MTLVEMRDMINSGTLFGVYVFTGEEIGIINRYIKKMTSKFDKVINAKSITEIYESLKYTSLFDTDDPKLYVIREDPVFLTDDRYWKDIVELLSNKNATLLLKYENLSRNTKFKNAFADSIVEFSKVSAKVLTKYVKEVADLPDTHCQYLISACGSDYSRIMLELDKVLNLSEAESIPHKDALQLLVDSDQITEDVAGSVFDLVDSIMRFDVNGIAQDLQCFKLRDDNPMYLLSMLHITVKSVLQIQLCGNKRVSDVTGLTQYQINSYKKYVGVFDNKYLVRIMHLVKYCESGIKSGLLSQDNVIDYLIVNL